LWGGIVGEDGPDNVKTGGGYPGNGYWAFQTFLANLRSTGVILAICSKNNENDVLECFQFRKNDIALDLTQFSAREINWNDKSNSLRKIATDLNISMDSIIFCDDSPVECGLVANDCPEVTVIQLGSNPELFQDQIVDSGVFDSLKITDTDKARADFYSSEVTRRNYAAEVNDKETYLATLGMILTVSIPKEGQIERTVQLFMRTNQFNLTNRRYEYNDIVSMMEEGKEVVMFELVDRYGSYGVISVFVMSTDNSVSTIDALVLSCRALGRGVESAILTVIEKKAIELRSNQLIGLYLSSKRNEIAHDFYSSHGFLKENDKGKFVCNLGKNPKLSSPAYIQIQYGRNCSS
jgi:FkbH-like protein